MTTEKKDGGPAFPFQFQTGEPREWDYARITSQGMSLRDWFAGMALQGLINRKDAFNDGPDSYEELARSAYFMADEMLQERGQ